MSVLVGVCLLYFVLAGVLLIPYPGIQNDEALFGNAIYAPGMSAGKISVSGSTIPIMVMNYVGALKALVYSLVFGFWAPSKWSVRLPAVLIAACAVWLFYRFLYRIAGRGAALTGCVLLATDVIFLLTATFDWGPVVLQHLLIAGGLLLVVRFHLDQAEWSLTGAFFLFGLALWDKAVFLWTFSGIAVAAAVLFHREIRAAMTGKRLLRASAAFLAGAAPFVYFNLSTGFRTFESRNYTLDLIAQKAAVMKATLNGGGLLAYFIDYTNPEAARDNLSVVESVSVSLSELAGATSTGLLPYALVLALLLAPLAWKRPGWKALPFFAVAFFVTWAEMLVTYEAGGSAHHTILLWFHVIGFVSVALSLGAARLPKSGAWAVGVVILAVALSNIVLMNQHLAGFIRFGPGNYWSDALYPLHGYIRENPAEVVYTADWGMDYSLRLLLEGHPPVREAINVFAPELTDEECGWVEKRISHPNHLFLGYTDGKEVFPQGKRRLQQCAERFGYKKQSLREIANSRGRPVFSLFQYVPGAGADAGLK